MTDIAIRLRRWTHDAHAVPASDLMDEAAGEIEMLRMALLTNAEREAIEVAALEAEAHQHAERAATLRGLLERTK